MKDIELMDLLEEIYLTLPQEDDFEIFLNCARKIFANLKGIKLEELPNINEFMVHGHAIEELRQYLFDHIDLQLQYEQLCKNIFTDISEGVNKFIILSENAVKAYIDLMEKQIWSKENAEELERYMNFTEHSTRMWSLSFIEGMGNLEEAK